MTLATIMNMTTGGWAMMLLAVSGSTIFLFWCIYKVVSTPGSTDHLHSQADIHPTDHDFD